MIDYGASSDLHILNIDQASYDKHWDKLMQLLRQILCVQRVRGNCEYVALIIDRLKDIRDALISSQLLPLNFSGTTIWKCWLERAVIMIEDSIVNKTIRQ